MKCIELFKFFIFSCAVLQLVSCDTPEKGQNNNPLLLTEVYGDAETVKSFSGNFENQGYEFTGANERSDLFAHTGKYSVELKKGADFGLGTRIENVPQGSYAEVSVWRYSTSGKGGLHISSDKVGDIYYLEGTPIVFEASGWQKIVVNVPINQTIDRLKIALSLIHI